MSNYKRKNAEQRQAAEQLLRVWFEDRVDRQINRYAAVNGKPTMPAIECKARLKEQKRDLGPLEPVLDPGGNPVTDKQGRPIMEAGPGGVVPTGPGERVIPGLHDRHRVRPVLDAQGNKRYDHQGNLITETVDVMDTLSADGVERHAARRGLYGIPGDQSAYTGKVKPYVPEHSAAVARAQTIMVQVHMITPDGREALEMRAAGYDDQFIADDLGCGKQTARQLVEEGLTAIITLLAVQAWKIRNTKPEAQSA